MTDTPAIIDVERERRIASLNVAVGLLQARDTDAKRLADLAAFIYQWTAASEAIAKAAQPSVADAIPGARPVPGHPNFAIVDGDKPMTIPVRKPAEVQKGDLVVEPPSDTN